MCNIRLQVVLTGGLGNQIFQALAGRFLSTETDFYNVEYLESTYIKEGYRNTEVDQILPVQVSEERAEKKHEWGLLNLAGANDIVYKLLLKHRLRNGGSIRISEEKTERLWRETPLVKIKSLIDERSERGRSTRKSLKLTIDGYWQNLEPYMEIACEPQKIIGGRSELVLPSGIHIGEYVAIHVRRGDYFQDKETYAMFGSAYDTVKYIEAAIGKVPTKLRDHPLIIVSDDLDWCRSWAYSSWTLGFKQVILINKSSLEDWSILNSAALNIISNSTYSFTAAMLNRNNIGCKLRCIMPCMYTVDTPVRKKNWNLMPGSLVI